MPSPSFKRIFVSSALLSGAVFAALTIPLAVAGSQLVVVRFQDEPLFSGKLKDVSAPYIGLATAIGLGVGAINLSLVGWKHSSKKSQKVVEHLSDLQQQLKDKEAQLEAVLVSESRLQAAGLDMFLDQTDTDRPLSTATATIAQPAITPDQALAYESTSSFHKAQAQAIAHPPKVQAITSATRAMQPLPTPASASNSVRSSNGKGKSQPLADAPIPVTSQIQELQNQLKQVAEQVEQLHGSLQTEPQPLLLNELSQPELTNLVLHQLNHRLHQLESNWTNQEMVS